MEPTQDPPNLAEEAPDLPGHWPQPWPDIDTSLNVAAGAMDDADVGAVTEGTLAELAGRLAAVQRIRSAASEAHAALTLAIAEVMEADTLDVEHVGTLKRKDVVHTSWLDEAAADRFRTALESAVVRVVALDVATGELDPMKANVARATARELLDALPKQSNVMAPARRRLGVWPSDFRTSWTSYTVSLEVTPHE